MKRVVSLLLAIVAFCSCGVTVFAADGEAAATAGLDNFTESKEYPEGKFTDVPSDAWYLRYVKSAYAMDLFKGKTETTFVPDGNVTVAQSIVLAARIHSVYYTGTAAFASSKPWYQSCLDYAIANGIVKTGEFSDFSRAATRAEVAGLFARAFPAEALAEINTVAFSAIPDVTIADPYGEEIYTLYRAGVVIGSDDIGTFRPNTSIRRSHVAAMIVRMAVADERLGVVLTEAATLPDTYRRGEARGVTTFYHATTSFPVASGLPKLTDAEIDWLIATEDYRLIADSITTLADCVNYYVRADFQSINSDCYKTFWFTHSCGQQIMAQRGGYCGGMCNATNYILRGDYEQILYNLVDGHVQMLFYIDGLYYLVNPADYARAEGAYWVDSWGGIYNGMIFCAEDIQTIADSMVETGWTTYRFQTYESTGDMFPQARTMEDPNVWIYPQGTEVTDWLGYDIYYAAPGDKIFPSSTGPYWEAPPHDWTTGEDWCENCQSGV